jgi:hypothetical protein
MLSKRDDAAAALVRRYAELMDHAELLAEEAEVIWRELSLDDIDARKRLAKLEIQISAQSVASDLGPKLLATLTSLGCTLAGRGVKGREGASAVSPARQAHDELAERRKTTQRQHGA